MRREFPKECNPKTFYQTNLIGNLFRPNANENRRIKWIKHVYYKQFKRLYSWNCASIVYITASTMYNKNIIRANELVIAFTYLVGDFINVFLFSSLFFQFFTCFV